MCLFYIGYKCTLAVKLFCDELSILEPTSYALIVYAFRALCEKYGLLHRQGGDGNMFKSTVMDAASLIGNKKTLTAPATGWSTVYN